MCDQHIACATLSLKTQLSKSLAVGSEGWMGGAPVWGLSYLPQQHMI